MWKHLQNFQPENYSKQSVQEKGQGVELENEEMDPTTLATGPWGIYYVSLCPKLQICKTGTSIPIWARDSTRKSLIIKKQVFFPLRVLG